LTVPNVRKGQADWPLPREEFEKRFRARFFDPAFESHAGAIDELLKVAWEAYCESRKSPRTRKAGPEFADPSYDLSVEWLAAREAIRNAQTRHDDASLPSRVLLIFGPYATSHDALDADEALHEETRNAARALITHVQQRRKGLRMPDEDLVEPRPK
jgi:hypothetical protein